MCRPHISCTCVFSGQGAGQQIQQQKPSCCPAVLGLWKWKCCPEVTLQTVCSGPVLERSPVDRADFRQEVKIHHVTRFSDHFWLNQSGREGICVCARAVPAALRGWTGDLGRSLCMMGSIPLRILHLRRGCFLPGCQPPAEFVSSTGQRSVQTLFMEVLSRPWGEFQRQRGVRTEISLTIMVCLDPHVKIG